MAANRVCWWEIGAEDAAGLAGFYAELFGWTDTVFGEMDYHCMDSGDGRDGGIGGGIFTVEGKTPTYLTIYVAVEDVDAMLERAVRAGAQSLGEPIDIPEVGRIAMVKDPDGNTLGLIKPAA